jgi:hypothetical protein
MFDAIVKIKVSFRYNHELYTITIQGINAMDILIAREELDTKPSKVTLTKVKDELKELGEKIYYFDKDNSHKNMMSLVDSLEGEGYNVYFREVKYGLADDEYMYELHAL